MIPKIGEGKKERKRGKIKSCWIGIKFGTPYFWGGEFRNEVPFLKSLTHKTGDVKCEN